ncbi:anti-phage dCTP deaminase [Morganella morganii]|uniref:anti-phage dCTP deaminase n=1 Tax=Morganella morganii TaxID=582 RepID=UPI0006901E09|nr:anti-phage dCTP deaminase [Morganella morganii]
MSNPSTAISKLLMSNSEFILIGLTGRTGSGCTTTAKLLQSKNLSFPDTELVENIYNGLNSIRYSIIKNYSKIHWKNFDIITISNLLTLYALDSGKDKFINFIKYVIGNYNNITLKEASLEEISNVFSTAKNDSELRADFFKILKPEQQGNCLDLKFDHHDFLIVIKKYSLMLKNALNSISNGLYIKVYQEIGNSIRKVGKLTETYSDDDFKTENIFVIPNLINTIVKIIRNNNYNSGTVSRIAIDTLRNPYEVKFFRDRFSAFHLVSINTNDDDRQSYLRKYRQFSDKEINELDSKESGRNVSKIDGYQYFTSQNVKKCIELSDIHFYNPKHEPDNNNALKSQIAWYIGLMLHPGLITPTTMERTMQVAYAAKLNSGCISRQVGAVVLDEENSIKSVGWNDVPKGQLPCSLRSLEGLENDFQGKKYSPFERSNAIFRKKAKQILDILSADEYEEAMRGLNKSYCFKDIKNFSSHENNQVHTRSLHAEENAFLQISKYGGTGVKNGSLYTTASPCELCAKKAYQLGIKEIVFIDPYPGIAKEHILESGEHPPKLTQFRGAIGRAYHKLYEPVMPYKDELVYSTCGKNKYEQTPD